jgi:hypothetical protein
MAQRVLEEMVLYDAETETGYSLNDSARAIWDLCDGRRSVQRICEELAESMDVAPDLLHEDVVTLVSDLQAKGLLIANESESGA